MKSSQVRGEGSVRKEKVKKKIESIPDFEAGWGKDERQN